MRKIAAMKNGHCEPWVEVNEKEWEAAYSARRQPGRRRRSFLADALDAAMAGRRLRIPCKDEKIARATSTNLMARRAKAKAAVVVFQDGLDVFIGPGEYKPKAKTPKAKKG